MINSGPIRRDPIGEKYFRPLEIAERISDGSFYAAAVLSLAALLVEKTVYPSIYDWVQTLFVLSVLSVFISGMAIRLHWRPKAEDKRRSELVSNASNVMLTVEKTELYYNNDETDPTRRLGVMLLENSHFSKSIASEMLTLERVKSGAYVALFMIALLVRKTDLALAATAAQAVFSEQIVSRWLRLEWLRHRFEYVHQQLYSLFQSRPTKPVLYARVLELYGLYETSKAAAGIPLSSSIFHKRNPELTAEWEQIKIALRL